MQKNYGLHCTASFANHLEYFYYDEFANRLIHSIMNDLFS